MQDEDSACRRPQALAHAVKGDIERRRVDVGGNDDQTPFLQQGQQFAQRIGRYHDLVPRPQAQRIDDQAQGIAPAGDGNRMRHRHARGEFQLEGGHFGSGHLAVLEQGLAEQKLPRQHFLVDLERILELNDRPGEIILFVPP